MKTKHQKRMEALTRLEQAFLRCLPQYRSWRQAEIKNGIGSGMGYRAIVQELSAISALRRAIRDKQSVAADMRVSVTAFEMQVRQEGLLHGLGIPECY